MAKVEKVHTGVKIVLELTESEAQVLVELFYRVGGHRTFSPRSVTDALLSEFEGLGIRPNDVEESRITGSISFDVTGSF